MSEWKVEDIGCRVRWGDARQTYRLEAIRRDAPSDRLIAEIISIVPSPRAGVTSYVELSMIEKEAA